ncbi:hypothetical protein BS47DRAFT_1372729 [Hydnum rufescens UP504]|uniref:Glycerol-3-phosphate dehydrogenase [NAD(+)] n=1 Tax=Hydnum rufescens UP504 TaxID=1448309 RepID=A0A9P6AXV8_9AGAM|nr:hypothetical protein BS47DRAFT_1372729 [Hydnum rufescens UP504]
MSSAIFRIMGKIPQTGVRCTQNVFPIPHARQSLVLGSGNFGSCLADHLADSEHEHPHYLKEHVFPDTIKAVGPELPDAEVIRSVDVLLFAIPTEGLRDLLTMMRLRWDVQNLPLVIFVNKGIESGTRALSLEIIVDTCGQEVAKASTFISGPSFAKEIIKRQPTQVSVVSLSLQHAQRAAAVFHQPWFRCYTGTDPIGVELAGALKNVYAIAAGAAAGLGFGDNTRAGLITRSLAEMTRLGARMGLPRVGDLFLTCSSPTSRNYTVGFRLGKGETLEAIISTLGSVAEGVTTTKGLHEIVKDLGVYAPIAEAVYEVLYKGVSAADMSRQLMAEPAADSEVDLPERAGGPVEELLRKLGISPGPEKAAH